MNKAIVTVVGKNRVGIIAGICTYLTENQINIPDITQTTVEGFFNIMMVVGVKNITKSLDEVTRKLEQVGEEIGVSVKIQREEAFLKMHRVQWHAQRIGRVCNIRRKGRKNYD